MLKKITFSYQGTRGFFCWAKRKRGEEPLVVLPGLSGTYEDVKEMVRHIAKKHPVVVIEYPGCGDIPPLREGNTIETYSSYIYYILRILKISNATLIAHCMGTQVAGHLARSHPHLVKKLILISIPYVQKSLIQDGLKYLTRLSLRSPEKMRWVFYLWRNRCIDATLALYVLRYPQLQKKVAHIARILTRHKYNDALFRENWRSALEYDFSIFTQITQPAHCIHGGEDVLVRPKEIELLTKRMQKATLALIPNAGHLPPVETPKEVARLVRQYTA